MKIFFDTSTLVGIDRRDKGTIELMKLLTKKNVELAISTVTVSEFLTGANLQPDKEKFVIKAKELLMQFSWIDLDGEVADKTAEILARRIGLGLPVEYQDVVIAASAYVSHSDFLITNNTKHFNEPFLEDKVFEAKEFSSKIRSSKLL